MPPVLRSSCEVAGPSTPHGQKEVRRDPCHLLALPTELLERCTVNQQEFKTLSSIAQVCSSLRALAEDCDLWRREWERVYGEIGAVQQAAASKAGGWKALFAARHAALKEAEPWHKPCAFEVQASVDMLAAVPPRAAGKEARAAGAAQGVVEAEASVPQEEGQEEEEELCVVFLVDGSGSVTEEDFRVMTGFMLAAVRGLAGGAAGQGAVPPLRSKVAVIQFSNDIRVEQGPVDVDVGAFEALMAGMARMNGGTNIALAVQKAGQLLKPLSATAHRVLVLLTDGRIDSHQSREARDMAARLGDEQANVRVHAYGVGRGVDKQELLRICAARDPDSAEDRYMGLMVLDEAPW